MDLPLPLLNSSPQLAEAHLPPCHAHRQHRILDSGHCHCRPRLSTRPRLIIPVILVLTQLQVARFPHGMQYLPLEFPLSALYVNTLLANLNARIFLRHTDISFNSLELKTPSNGLAFRSANTSGNSRMHGKTEVCSPLCGAPRGNLLTVVHRSMWIRRTWSGVTAVTMPSNISRCAAWISG